MKTIYFLVAFFLFTGTAISQQTPWQWVNPLPQGNLLNGAAAPSADTIFAVGDFGTVMRSTNAGTTWQILPNAGGMNEQLYGVYFPNTMTGYAVGTTGQYVKTTDAGATWFYHQSPTLSDLYAVFFVSSTTGWVTGANGVVLGTTNGGTTWTVEPTGTTSNLYAVNFASATTGWVAGADGKILKTTNAGVSWVTQATGTTQAIYSLDFTSTTTGYAVGAFGIILKTVNGGTAWSPQISNTTFSLYATQFITASIGWAAGSFGAVLKTTNGGLNWFAQSSGSYNDIYGMSMLSSTAGWMVGDFGTLISTSDGGTTWQLRSSGTKNILNGMHFPDPATGFSVGEEGTIIKSTDGGLSWTQQSSGLFQTLYGVYFSNSTTGWAVGDSAVILRTTTGGANWVEQNSHNDVSLYSVHFPTATRGWAVGDLGTILASTNGGVTWAPQTSNTSSTLLRIKFLTPTLGWAVGFSGKILKTTDAGVSWISQTSGTTRTLYSLETIDANNVVVVGDFGLVLKTTNGGTSWVEQTTDTDVSLYGVTFYTASLGWAAGDDGVVIATSNGGVTWTTQPTGTPNTLYDVQLSRGVSGGVIFAAGVGGTIICSGASPLPVKTWVGTFDSLWTNPGNWSPNGVPQKNDSVIIAPAARMPYLRTSLQQINIASLRINAGAALHIGSGLGELVVKGSVIVDGILDFEVPSNLHITVGKDFVVSLTGTFNPSQSTVVFTSNGQVRGSFNNVLLQEGANLNSIGNVTVRNNILILSNLTLRPSDTLSILNPYPLAFQGNGSTGAGTIRRAIQAGSQETYRFESPGTYIRFYPVGDLPDTVTVSMTLDAFPPGLPESLFVKRYYEITAIGGSNYLSTLALRYDTSETDISIENLGLFRDSSDVVKNMGQADFIDSDYVSIVADSIDHFSRWYIGYYDYIPHHAFEFQDSVILIDNGGLRDTIVFGAFPTATNGIDVAYGEAALGPKPGPGTFDVRWDIPSTQGSLVDIRDVLTRTLTSHTYTGSIQPGPGGYPFTVRWDSAALPPGTFLLRDAATHGTQFSVNMKTQRTFVITNPSVTKFEILHVGPIYYQFQKNWNLLSNPLTPVIDAKKTRLFPTTISSAYYFDDGYKVEDTLHNGIGYWLKFGSAQTVGLDGFARLLDTIDVVQGWNMIGSISNAIKASNVTQIPPGNVVSSYFQFTTGYTVADSIHPSKGYWVKATNTGKLILSSSPSALPKNESAEWGEKLASANSITVIDKEGSEQTLYFTREKLSDPLKDYFEMPPYPPREVFDVRFASERMYESLDRELPPVRIQSASYPISLRWHLREPGMRSVRVVDAATGRELAVSVGSSQATCVISDASVTALLIRVESDVQIPKQFSLHQNYPNPFNPTTRVAFDLPEAGLATLKVYDILGQEVAQLVANEALSAGSHSIVFDASNYGSGVYFYRIAVRGESGKEYGQVRKMMLIK